METDMKDPGNEREIDEAIERLRPLLSQGGSAQGHYLHARLLMAKGRTDAAAGALLKTIELDPGHSSAHNDLGCVYFQRREYQQAFDSLKKAVLLDRTNYGALANLIKLLLESKAKGATFDPVAVVKELFAGGIRDIGAKALPKDAERALVVYVEDAIPWYLAGMLDHFPYIRSHTMFWETAEMVRLLNESGYVVDYFGLKEEDIDQKTDYRRYGLIIDGGTAGLIGRLPPVEGQTRVYYSTGQHWLRANLAELSRNWMFYRRHGMVMPAERQQKASFCDERADFMTYFGNPGQLSGYSEACEKVPLSISSVHVPEWRERDIAKAKGHFIWLGGHAMIHKGLDLAVEAFTRLPQATLHIVAYLEIEPRFLSWLKVLMEKHPNIVYHGSADVASPGFERLAWDCLGTVYVSAAEGGPGSVAQLLHFGIIPIVTPSANVRAEGLGLVVEGEEDTEIMEGIERHAASIMAASDGELIARSERIRAFALANHTREAYSMSFKALVARIGAGRQTARAAAL